MIRIRGLRKKLGNKQVLDGLDLDVASGETLVVIGRSGTGKSVLLKHIIGLMAPDEGSIEIEDEEIVGMPEARMNEVRMRFGMLFQSAALFDSMSVGENVGLALREHHLAPPDDVARIVSERLSWVGLQGGEDMKPSSLSGGMRKRVGLARAIAVDPAYILYDEPTTGLDPITADAINELIRSLQQRLGVTSVVVTHDMTSAYHVGDRIAMINDGRVVFQGTIDQTRKTTDPMVRQFIQGSREGPIKAI